MVGTLNLGPIFCKDSEEDIVGFPNSNNIRLIDWNILTGDYVFMFAVESIFYSSKLQLIVSLSFCKGKYTAL